MTQNQNYINTLLNTAIPGVYDTLFDYARSNNFWTILGTAFGSSYNRLKAESILAQWKSKNFSALPNIQVVSGTVLGNARAGYGATQNKIYLSDSFLNTATVNQIQAILLEEIGHYLDAQINLTDTSGDEGEYFSALVRGVSVSATEINRIQNENDHRTITLNSQNIAIEEAGITLYETVKLASLGSAGGASVKSSGSNYVWVTRKGANSVLKLYNGTTTLPIANSVYDIVAVDNYNISGNTVVYAKKDGNDTEIYRYSGGTTTKLTNNTINDYAPQIAGNNVVWYANDGTDVEIFRNNGTTTTQLTNNDTDERDLKLSGSNAVWVGWDGNDYEIYLNNGTTTTQLTNNTTD
ncbi:MAG: TolB family protein, partial [Dolichospermum sp.]